MRSITNLRKKMLILTIHMMISMIILSGTLIIPVAAAVTTVKVDPLSQTISIGGTFTVNVFCVPVQSIKSYELKVVFNPSLIKANSVTKGNIFNGHSTFFNAGTIDNTAGTITNIYNVILGSGSVSSSGTFVTISFTAKSTAGTSSIKLNNVGVTNNLGYIPITITNGSIQIISQSSNIPVFEYISPTNKSTNIPISTTSLSLTIRDPDNDQFDYTIQTSPNVGRVSVTGTHDGTKQCTISGLKYSTTYRWYVNATDGLNWKRQWYTFTTGSTQINNPLVYSGVTPTNGSKNIPISTSSISLIIRDPEGKSFDYTIQTSPNVGRVSVTGTYNGTKQCTISGLKYSTTYRWYVNATDVVSWKRGWYTFTTAPASSNSFFIFSGMNPSNGSRNIPLSTLTLTVILQNSKGHAFNYYIKTSPQIGSTSGTNRYNGSKAVSISGLTYGTTYHWYLSCKDVSNGQWSNQSYWFTTESDPSGGNPPPPSNGGTSSNETEPPATPENNNPPNPPTKPYGPTFIEPGVNYNYISSAFDPDNDSIRLCFDWGDETYSNWTGFVPSNTTVSLSHTWGNVSTYNISVIAQDENGTNSSWSDTLFVTISQVEPEEEQAIVEILASTNNISTNENVQFNASNCFIPGGTIVSYSWEFGDGKRSTGKTATHTYTNSGQYEVTLEITDHLGETYNKKIIVTVAANAQETVQDTKEFIPIIFTIILIGMVITLIFILILISNEKINLQVLKKYIIPDKNWIQQHMTKIAGIKHSISIKPKPIVKVPDVKEIKAMNIPVHYAPTANNVKKAEDIELDYIHSWIDKIIIK